MIRRLTAAGSIAVVIAAAGFTIPTRAANEPCSAVASIQLPETTVKSAGEVAGPSLSIGSSNMRNLPAFCRVAAMAKPAVNFEVWMPLQNWNGKFQGVGNGANAGSISYNAMAEALRRGYAVASTDTGHATTNGRDAAWAVGHPELLVDFGYRAFHVTTEHAKKIVERFYGRPASQSYYVGCSTGGRQGLMEAQRFPDDYDGIIAGAPAANWTRFQTGGHLWVVLALNKDPESYVPASKLQLLGDAVNAACDKLDGIADGVLDDPRKCRFDPTALQCKTGQDSGSCFTPKQVTAVKQIWAGARNSAGEKIYPGYMPGAEAAGGWATYMSGSGPLTGNHWDQASNVLKYMIFEDPKWDFRSFDFDRDLKTAQAKLGQIFDAFDPDLSRLERSGGKLILYHGWNDPSISPLNTIDYYERVTAALTEKRTQQFVRLFMAPGMLHCGGGPGPNSFDMLAALENWVEKGVAPDAVVASHATNGVVDRTRPLCAYPKTAVYTGRGSTDEAANFTCR
jgi:pimeloyl-ACP methyl ester carboxylesterase